MLRYSVGVLFCMLALLGACKQEEDVSPDVAKSAKVKNTLYEIMQEWYLWNDQLPVINVNEYQTPVDLLNALRNKTTDRWSYIEDEKTFDQYFKDAKFVGLGFGMKLDANQQLKVSFVYKNSPMNKQGVTRGYTLKKVNGQSVSSLIASNTLSTAFGEDKVGIQTRLEVEDLLGNVREITVGKEIIIMNTVLFRTTYEIGSKKAGYLVYNTFIDKSVDELNEAFTYFQNEGVTELVLDLRYNGGGSLEVAQHLASQIATAKAGTNEFVELTYNTGKSNSNKPYLFNSNVTGLNLSRLFVITSRSSASASEAVINGLKPYMEVITIGDATHGKPVGMNVWKAEGYAIVPITFKVANVNGQAEYFEGIPADARVQDDLSTLFGDMKEDCLEQSLYYIEHGSFSPLLASGRKGNKDSKDQEIILEGFRAEIGAF